jgi:3-methyladenine DNA glycosylase AlkD
MATSDKQKTVAAGPLKAKQFIEKLKAQQSEGDQFFGVRMGQVFARAKEFSEMPVSEIEKLLESPIHEARAGAISIMDRCARIKKTPEARRKKLYDLYMKRHDRVNNWDLVDLGCLYMVGSYLFDKPRNTLYKLARSKNLWERRTAIVGTCYFIRQGDVTDAFKIAEILVNDQEDLVHKATGWMLRTAGAKNGQKLLDFLDKYAATMPRTLLRYAIEKLDKKERLYYMGLKKA